MKQVLPVLLCLLSLFAHSQGTTDPKNIFIITIDGFRWQEVFLGADTSLLGNANYVSDPELMQELYGGTSPEVRRQKLLPFFWNVIAKRGQINGNRLIGSKVNVSNAYKISYPGYNELLTGYADPIPVLNTPKQNRNISVLEFLNQEPEYKGRVAAFSSWNIFPFILNRNRNKLEVNSGYEEIEAVTIADSLFNQVQDQVNEKTHCRYDQLTFVAAKEYISQRHPKVVMLGFGETDEFAHKRQYDRYLQQANAIDKMLAELWYFVQTDPVYRNNTYFVITTDHGRGKKPTSWFAHNLFVGGSGEAWQALIGPGIPATGECSEPQQVYQKQIAATVAMLLGKKFSGNHSVAPVLLLTKPLLQTTAVVTEPLEVVVPAENNVTAVTGDKRIK